MKKIQKTVDLIDCYFALHGNGAYELTKQDNIHY